MKKLLIFLLTALLAFGVGWAETSTLTFTTACNGSGTASDGASWTVTSDASESTYDDSKGIHYGTNKAAVSHLTLTSSSFTNKTISKIVVNASGASSTSAVLNVTVGGSAFGSQANLSSTATNYTFEGNASGEVVVRISQSSAKKALYCKSITVTYETGGSTPVTVDAPVLSINGTTVTGDQTVDAGTVVTITAASGNYISYTTDGTDPETSGTAEMTTGNAATVTINATTRIRAIAIDDDHNSSDEVDYTFTVNSGGGEPVDYSLVTGNVNTYDSYVLVYGGNNAFSTKALGTSGVNETTANGYTCSNNVVSVTDDSDINILTFESAGDGRYYIKGSDGNYWGCLSTMLSTSPTKPEDNDKYKWQITVAANGDATIMNVGNTNTNYPSYLKYRAAAYGFKIYSATQSDAYNGKLYSHAGETSTVEAPTFSPDGGKFTGSVEVTITSPTEGATIYYTTDGTDPVVNRSTSSIENGGTVTLTQNGTLKAIATLNGVNSPIATSQSYTITAAPATTVYEKITSTDDLTDGNYLIVYEGGDLVFDGSRTTLDAVGNTQGVTISNHQIETSDAIYFTYDATAKTLKSASGYYIGQTKNDNGLASNENTSYQNTISFETDGNANIVSGGAYLRYNSSSNQLRFRYYKSSSYTAQQAIQLYKEVGTPKVKTPTFSVAEGTYTSAQVVEISCATSGATIYYTTDGSTPTTSSTPYTGAITVDHDMTIKAIAVAPAMDDSEVATATYTINLTPTMTVAPTELTFGSIDGGQLTVTTSNLSAGVNASVLNTNYNANTDKWTVTPNTLGTDGGSMTVNYGGRLLKSDNTVRVSSNGVANVDVPVHYKHSDPIYIVTNANNWDFTSGVQMTRNGDTYSYTLNATADTYLVFTKKVGSDVNWNTNYLFGPKADASSDNPNADWWLTEASVNTDFPLDSTIHHTVKMHKGTYTITLNAATNQMRIVADVHAPEFSVEGGILSGTQNVEITCDTEGAHIYYTTDGSTPSATNGTLYTGPVTISESTTLKAVAIFGNITSPVTTANYVITPAFVQKDYERVTNINDLVPGQTYLLVYKTSDDATEAHVMGPISGDIGTQIQVNEKNNGLITSTEAMAPVTLVKDENNWTLLTRQGILKAQDANNLYVGSDAHTWTISQVDDANTFKIQSNTETSRYLQYNPSSTRFACYKTTSNQKYVYIYRESSTPAVVANPTNVAIELAAGVAQGSNTFTVGGRNLSEGVTLTLSAEDQAKGFSLSTNSISKEAALAGNVEVTVTYNGNAATETATITLSSAGASDVTVTVNATREPLTVTITPADGATFVGQTMSDQVTISSNVAGATIEYSTDGGQTWQPYNGGFNVSVATVGGTVTVMARATITDGSYSETATAQATYTRQPRGETLYEKVTSEDQIKAGEKYILVYEGTPEAISGFYSDDSADGGIGSSVVWKTQGEVVDIAGTSVIPFTLSGKKDAARFYGAGGYLESSTREGGGINVYEQAGENYAWNIVGDANGYYLTWKSYYNSLTYTLLYNSNMSDASRGRFRVYNNSSYPTVYLYVLRPAVEEPVITPATGTYYENEQVTISCEAGTTVYYTTDGSDPTISSTPYQGPFTVNYVDGGTTTIKAVAVDDEGNVSTIATVTYTWGKPSVAINPDSRNVTTESVNVTLTSTPAGAAAIYYTTDGNTPTTASEQYSGAFSVSLPSVGDVANVKAIAVYNGLTSEVASATYTRVEKVIDVKAPFFSPIENHVYYGDQEIEILCASNNADIYYEMATVAGDVAPDASSVATPTRSSSTSYDEPITMTAGNSYYVKAIAYIGNYTSKVIEGWFTIKSTSEWSTPTDATIVLENVAQLRTTASGSRVTFRNPIQVVYMSTMANDPTPGSYTHGAPEYVYVRDNSGYGVIYFGKGATMWAKETSGRRNSPATIFKMGDWIDGSEICGTTGTWENGLIPQVGTGVHTIYSWPSSRLGNTPIMPEEATCADVRNANETSNLCGHYLHLRNTTLNGVEDYNADGDDYRHSGTISDNSGACTYYDRFWLYSGTTSDNISFTYSNTYYTMSGLGHYDQNWFNSKGEDATFDVFCVGDYYSKIPNPYEVYPIDFLWTYKPVITVTPGETVTDQVDTYAVAQTVTISATQPEWAAEDVVIYYKTDEMDDWAEYTGPFVVSSTTSVQTYAEVYAKKNDAAQTDYNDYVRSVTVSQDFYFVGIEDPEIAPESRVIEIVNGNETVEVLIDANNGNNSNVITVYTTDGSMPSATNGTPIAAGDLIELDPITETTTVTAISYLPDANGNPVLWSNVVTETYTFVKKNGVIYDLLTTAPTVGNVYVIVNKDAYMGMSTKQNENNRGSVGVMFTDDTKTKVYGNDELALFVLEKADGNRYYFKNINGNGYLTVAGNTGLKTGEADYYASASVEIGDQSAGYPATITFRGDKVRTMRYSANSRTFSTYTDAALNQDVFLYGVNATPLAYIESTPSLKGKQVTVSDELIGTWAVKNLLWAKDQGYANVKTFAKEGQQDYVKDILKYQRNEGWDQSNWVILDFTEAAGGAEMADEFVGKKIEMASVTGTYVDDVNYTIQLQQAPELVKDGSGKAIDVSGDYPGYMGVMGGANYNPQAATEGGTGDYSYAYNTYVPANFLEDNLNAPFGDGFVAGDAAAASHVGEQLFFVNPKVMEVARIWAVYAGTGEDGKDIFTVYEPDQQNVNGWGVEGAFSVEWDYNRLVASDPNSLGRPQGIADKVNEAFLFHAVVASNTAIANAPLRAAVAPQGTADATPSMSRGYRLYPLDFPSDGSNYTAVSEVRGMKTVESVRYYNIMGMESEKPFEGINIVVTRYSDGTTSTAKVLR